MCFHGSGDQTLGFIYKADTTTKLCLLLKTCSGFNSRKCRVGQDGEYLKTFPGRNFILAHLYWSKVIGWASADSLAWKQLSLQS